MLSARDLAAVARARDLLASGRAREIRISAGLSLREVGQALGVDSVHVWRWETGVHTPRAGAALRYADLLAVLEGELKSRVQS
jgi:transcriptional regulator with XRE-family HTH domain